MQTEQAEIAAKHCAADVSRRYEGKPCMGTSIHARTPVTNYNTNFFSMKNSYSNAQMQAALQ